MARVRQDFPVDDWIALYQSGLGYEEIAGKYGVGAMTVWKRLRERGAGRSRSQAMRERFKAGRVPFADEVASRYVQGESAKAIADALNITRTTIGVILTERGIPIRGRRDSALLRFTDPDQRARVTRKAHFALGKGEAELAQMLTERGERIERQHIVGHYNLDLALPAEHIAVEVCRTNPLRPCSREHKRGPDIMDRGWHIVYVWVAGQCLLAEGAADEIVAFAKKARRNPSVRRQYRVIRGCGQLIAAGRDHFDEMTFVGSPHRGVNLTTAHALPVR